jgi:hypothetical protein
MKPIKRKDTLTNQPSGSRMQRAFGFSSGFIQEVAKHLEPAIQHVFRDFFQHGCHGSLLDPHNIPHHLERKAMLEILNPKYFWRDFIHHPDIITALHEDAELDYWENLLAAPYLLKNEERLLLDWQSQRPAYYNFAYSNTSAWVEQYSHREADLQKKLQLCRLAAFRYLDAAITGRQTLEPHPPFGGEDGLECRLCIPDEKGRASRFIRVGIVKKAEYGTSYRNSDQTLLEAVYAETDPGSATFYPQHCVVQLTQLLAPLLPLADRVNIPDEMILDLIAASIQYQEINSSSPLPESELQTHRLHLGKLQHLEKRFSKEWFSQHSLSPLWLDLTGFRPFRNTKLEPLTKALNSRYRDTAGLEKATDSLLVWKRTRQVILLPILNRCLQLRCLQIYQELDPSGYMDSLEKSQQVVSGHLSDREQLLQQLQYCFSKSLDYLEKNQQKVLEQIEKSPPSTDMHLVYRSTEN